MIRTNVPILIVGDSGTGKSSTIGRIINEKEEVVHEGLPPKETLVLNIEDKETPIVNSSEFTEHTVRNIRELFEILQVFESMKEVTTEEQRQQVRDYYKGKPCPLDYNYIVIDSLTAVTELVQKYADTLRGYEVWREYNAKLREFIALLKRLPQQVIVMALPEQKAEGLGDTKVYAKVKGQELKFGYFESQFTIVLFTNPIYEEVSGEVKDVVMQFRMNRFNTAKSPTGMFQSPLQNDAMIIINKMREYYGKEGR